jgi:hypothetical protein
MTQDEIEEMAELSGLYLYKTNEELIYCLTYFAKLVAEKEREQCAKICDAMDSISDYYTLRVELICAQAIRAREQK